MTAPDGDAVGDVAAADEPLADAVRAADAAARSAGIEIREVDDMAGHTAVDRLWTAVWGGSAMSAELLRALAKAHNYVAAAYAGGRMVGACAGFFHAPAERALHSHVAGVSAEAAGRGVGFALKLHQRVWALERGLDAITWTYDPLIARNAHFNLTKLHARPVEYLPNFYGAMPDAINRGDESDRVLVRWDLRDPDVAAACMGSRSARPAEEGGLRTVAVPADIEALRTTDPAAARRWRAAVRDGLLPVLSGGGAVVGFGRDGYLVRTAAPTAPPGEPTSGPTSDPTTEETA
ncbi:GNAT family N-acetyltransferase [Promicromonospora iranensis]|uniref:GNAT superfamily acetyltransferase n=1 Tax=Promicromonospora iranensis TaxID=1105144 RepID=A0ABU2CQD5_9MICO|nr:GNAT family N-acetyltransferase [Promicromonospora iranensis]MDR7383554.1 putative GNAT superfamily acetyltransferase [Promicromonospora iranensis]